MFGTKTVVLCAVAAAACMGAGPLVHATVVSQDFESSSGYTLRASAGNMATRSTDVAHSGTHSIALSIPNDSGSADVAFDVPAGQVQLGGAVGTYWAYVPETSGNQDWAPYVYYAVDTNQDGTYGSLGAGGDSLVLAFYGVAYNDTHVVSNEWMQWGIFGNTNVHVVGNRTGLGSMFTTARPAGVNGDTFADLGGTAFAPGVTWGDLDILLMRVQAGSGSTELNNYRVYVDDMRLSGLGAVAVPEPPAIAMFLLGLGGVLLLGWRRRRLDAR